MGAVLDVAPCLAEAQVDLKPCLAAANTFIATGTSDAAAIVAAAIRWILLGMKQEPSANMPRSRASEEVCVEEVEAA